MNILHIINILLYHIVILTNMPNPKTNKGLKYVNYFYSVTQQTRRCSLRKPLNINVLK